MDYEYSALNVLDGKGYAIRVADGIIADLRECPDVPEGRFICPGGLIDTQVNGAVGFNYSGEDLDVNQVRLICEDLAKHGTLQHFATIITRPEELILRNLDVIVKATEEDEFVRRSITGKHLYTTGDSHPSFSCALSLLYLSIQASVLRNTSSLDNL